MIRTVCWFRRARWEWKWAWEPGQGRAEGTKEASNEPRKTRASDKPPTGCHYRSCPGSPHDSPRPPPDRLRQLPHLTSVMTFRPSLSTAAAGRQAGRQGLAAWKWKQGSFSMATRFTTSHTHTHTPRPRLWILDYSLWLRLVNITVLCSLSLSLCCVPLAAEPASQPASQPPLPSSASALCVGHLTIPC